MVCLCFYLEIVFNKGTRQLKNGSIGLTPGYWGVLSLSATQKFIAISCDKRFGVAKGHIPFIMFIRATA